jgi:hypothetical protein
MQGFLGPVTTIQPRRTDPVSLLYVRSYLLLRLGVGVIGIALPFTLVLVDGLVFHGKPFPRVSISAYYYSGMRDLMIGAICSTGVFLLAYKIAERNLDNTISLVGGIGALVAALSPPSLPPGVPPGPLQLLVGTAVCAWLHFGGAAVLLISLAALSFFFGLREGARDPRVGKLPPGFWRIFHWVCAGLIAAALIWMGLFSLFPQLGPSRTLLYGETLSLFAFGVSWLMKGLELDTLQGHPAPLLRSEMSLSPNRA